MRLLLNGNLEFDVVSTPELKQNTIQFPLADVSMLPSDITGDIVLQDTISWPTEARVEITESGEPIITIDDIATPEVFVLYKTSVNSWLRYYTTGNTLCFTNIPLPPAPYEPTPEEIEAELALELEREKDRRIAQTKTKLATYLENNPMLWTDGRYYNVTQEKQSLLTSQISLYQVAINAGMDYELKWNSTGGVCTTWTIEELSALALAIGLYVQPLVTYQQICEISIMSAQSMEDLDSIVCDYSTVHSDLEEETDQVENEEVIE